MERHPALRNELRTRLKIKEHSFLSCRWWVCHMSHGVRFVLENPNLNLECHLLGLLIKSQFFKYFTQLGLPTMNVTYKWSLQYVCIFKNRVNYTAIELFYALIKTRILSNHSLLAVITNFRIPVRTIHFHHIRQAK